MMKKQLLFGLLLCALGAHADVTIHLDASQPVAQINRANLLGINIAVYNQPHAFDQAITGLMGDLNIGLIRIPGGSASDKYYWNGNGALNGRQFDQSKYKAPYWEIDYSAYSPGFWFDSKDWGNAWTVNLDAKTMHEVTRKHPMARNMVTVNVGSGTPEMAAEWVRWANIQNQWDVKYWELGNELNGAWETGHIRPDGSKMTAEKYIELFVEFAKAMKAVDPTIKIGGPSCDVEHPEYFEPLLREAGDHVDFITLHAYWLRTSFATEEKLFDGIEALKPFTAKLDKLVEKYQPGRVGEIEYSVTEWNSKLPKDQDAYRLVNGLWFAAWVGEAANYGIDSATVWDMFSGDDNGHGMLVQQKQGYAATGRYWGFWLWSHYMADTLLKPDVENMADPLHIYATRNDDSVFVMVMNESRTESFPVEINLSGFQPVSSGKEITLSSREYFWNPVTRTPDWNSGPSVQPREMARRTLVTVPPYCVKVYQFNKTEQPETSVSSPDGQEAELKILLPESGLADLKMEGWVRAFEKGSDQPYKEDLGTVSLSADQGANIELIEPELFGAASRFILTPAGPGAVTVTATCGRMTTEQVVDFTPVELEERVAWTFEGDTIQEPHKSPFEFSLAPTQNGTGNSLQVTLPGVSVMQPNNHLFAITKYPRDIPKERIGGVLFDLMVPKDFETDPEQVKLQVILQSENAFWIPSGEVVFPKADGQWRSFQLEIPNKKFLKAMDKGFSVLLVLYSRDNPQGTVCIDNLGFLLRPE